MRRLPAALALLLVIACGSSGTSPPGSPLSIPQLKFAVIDSVGPPVYCDPDYYPIVRQGAEEQNAEANYASIRADGPLYSAIAAHEHLPAGDLNASQKLTLYRAYKLLRALTLTPSGDGYSFQIRVASNSGSASFLLVDGTVRADGAVNVTSRKPTGPPMCPICLAATTLIATPHGAVPVTDLQPGMLVWTQALDGERVAARVLEVGSMPAPSTHLMVHLVLADGRALLVSPGHRTADGRALGELAVGDAVDGSTVVAWELVPYRSGRTYDLLPTGATGHYWANGILLASTLAG
jgi:hypothetical protein